VEVAISNCVIKLATDKVKTFKEIYRILKKDGKGRMIISDLVTSKEVNGESNNAEDWCSCIDGALTKENYINSIKETGFQNIRILNEKTYMEPDAKSDRKITSVVIGAEQINEILQTRTSKVNSVCLRRKCRKKPNGRRLFQ
jgi:arsenite methyltransferase